MEFMSFGTWMIALKKLKMSDMEKQRLKTLKPRDCERILNYNGFYPDKQNGGHVIFKDDLGRHITIPRGNINPLIWKRLAKEYNLVEPSKVFK